MRFYRLLAIRDFPFIGTGHDIFRKALPTLYPVYSILRVVDYMNARNCRLQVALNLAWPDSRSGPGVGNRLCPVGRWAGDGRFLFCAVAVGPGAELVAEFRYGLTEAITFGAKLGIFFFFAIPLAVSLGPVTGVGARLGAVAEPAT